MGLEEYPSEYYEELLEYVKDKYEGQRAPVKFAALGFCEAFNGARKIGG